MPVPPVPPGASRGWQGGCKGREGLQSQPLAKAPGVAAPDSLFPRHAWPPSAETWRAVPGQRGGEPRSSPGLTGSCVPGGRAAASVHGSALDTEQARWCSPSGRGPAQAGLPAGWGVPGGRGAWGEGSDWEGPRGRVAHRPS